MYVAAYSVHQLAAQAYMNIAFPLPGGNLASILHLKLDSDDGTAVTLSTLPSGPRCDAGIFWVLGRAALCLRLPMNETIAVWAAESPHAPAGLAAWAGAEATAMARHDVWLFGLRLFSLDYAIAPVASRVSSP